MTEGKASLVLALAFILSRSAAAQDFPLPEDHCINRMKCSSKKHHIWRLAGAQRCQPICAVVSKPPTTIELVAPFSPPARQGAPARPIENMTLRQAFDRELVVASMPMWLMTAADLTATEYCIANLSCRESNRLCPTRARRIGISVGLNVSQMFMAAFLRKHRVRVWWLPMHIVAGAHSVGLVVTLGSIRRLPPR